MLSSGWESMLGMCANSHGLASVDLVSDGNLQSQGKIIAQPYLVLPLANFRLTVFSFSWWDAEMARDPCPLVRLYRLVGWPPAERHSLPRVPGRHTLSGSGEGTLRSDFLEALSLEK